MKRSFLGLAAAAVLVLAYVVLRGGPSPAEGPRHGAAPLGTGVVGDSARGDTAEDAATAPDATDTRRRGVTPDPTAPVADLGPHVIVVDGATGLPVAGAEVRVWTGERKRMSYLSYHFVLRGSAAGREHVAERSTEPAPALTDAAGRGSLPGEGPLALVLAEHGDQLALTLAPLDELVGTELRLEPPTSLEVAIEDVTGGPRPGAYLYVRTETWSKELQADDQGRVHLHHVPDLLPSLSATLELDARMHWRGDEGMWLTYGAPYTWPRLEAGRLLLDTKDDRPGCVLKTPTHGRLRVQTVDAAGSALDHGDLTLFLDLELGDDRWKHRASSREDRGRAELWLPTGAQVRVTADHHTSELVDPEEQVFSGVVPGPDEPPLTWMVEVEPEHRLVLRLRLVTPTNEPIAGAEVHGRLESRTGTSFTTWGPHRTDTQGLLSIELRGVFAERILEGSADHDLVLTTAARQRRGVEDLGRGAQVALPPSLGEELLDLGEVVLEAPAAWIEGRATYTDGSPVVRGWVNARPHDGPDGRPFNTQAPVSTGDDGRFSFAPWDGHEHYDLVVTSVPGRLLEPVSSKVGTEPVELVLHRTGVLAGSVVVAPGMEPESLYVKLVPTPPHDPEDDLRREETAMVLSSGKWSEWAAFPGFYDVHLISRDRGIELLIESVEVVAGETVRDPRLQELRVEPGD